MDEIREHAHHENRNHKEATIHLGSVSQQQRWQQQEATIMDTLAGKLHKQNDPIKRARA